MTNNRSDKGKLMEPTTNDASLTILTRAATSDASLIGAVLAGTEEERFRMLAAADMRIREEERVYYLLLLAWISADVRDRYPNATHLHLAGDKEEATVLLVRVVDTDGNTLSTGHWRDVNGSTSWGFAHYLGEMFIKACEHVDMTVWTVFKARDRQDGDPAGYDQYRVELLTTENADVS